MLALHGMTRTTVQQVLSGASGVLERVVRAQAAVPLTYKTRLFPSLTITLGLLRHSAARPSISDQLLRTSSQFLHGSKPYLSIMAGTRSSARLAKDGQSSPPASNVDTSVKRKASTDASASASTKRGKKEETQKTLEQTGIDTDESKKDETQGKMQSETKEQPKKEVQDTEMKDDHPGMSPPTSSTICTEPLP